MEAKVAFDSVCAKIVEKYKESGWKYAKSNHWMTKKDKNFTYKQILEFYYPKTTIGKIKYANK